MIELSASHNNQVSENKPRNTWKAILLHLLVPGFGQFYSNQFKRAIIFYTISEIIFITGILTTAITEKFFVLLISIICSIIFWLYVLIDAIILTRVNQSDFYPTRFNNRWCKYILVFIIVIAISWSLDYVRQKYIIEAYKTTTESMANTLLTGDMLIAKKCGYNSIKNNDVVILKSPQDQEVNYIKRYVAKGGQTIEIKDKQLIVDGEPIPLPEGGKHIDDRILPFALDTYGGKRDNMPPFTVPDNNLYVMGDNRDNSIDSRFWGAVPKENVIGKTMFIHWSFNSEDSSVRWERIGMQIE